MWPIARFIAQFGSNRILADIIRLHLKAFFGTQPVFKEIPLPADPGGLRRKLFQDDSTFRISSWAENEKSPWT